MTNFTEFQSGHRDLVTVTRFNFYGNRLLTASLDHRVRVWDQKESGWELTDTWRAHDAEIRDAAWNGPFTGQHIGTVGEDLKFKIWHEDVTQPPNSGRRFRNIFRLTSPIRTPYVSLDFHNLELETWLALITRDGLLTILEPVNSDNLSEWQPIDQFRVCAEPARGEETSFKVQFHHDPVDITHLVKPSWDSKSLSIVVAAMDTVKIYRMNSDRQFYHALELGGHRGLVRDVAWANGCVRGFDLIASGSSDGMARVFKVHTEWEDKEGSKENEPGKIGSPAFIGRMAAVQGSTQSSIGSALASCSPATHSDKQRTREGPFKHSFEEVALIDTKHLDVWQVEFSHAGDCLLTSGDDGKVRFWKRAITGDWLEFAEMDTGDK